MNNWIMKSVVTGIPRHYTNPPVDSNLSLANWDYLMLVKLTFQRIRYTGWQ